MERVCSNQKSAKPPNMLDLIEQFKDKDFWIAIDFKVFAIFNSTITRL